ncbi:hypothetical protein HPB50_026115 [Hyalomma asiaticum]|uniref:Uncharacterized protein n=1 Tax=Hyalomma asiaticum TaxID=266040 RepID=A0ACB7TTJ7_HYAAI|nr:hypothetical protein HPB50_026115 [Hyalomma asiaticum]
MCGERMTENASVWRPAGHNRAADHPHTSSALDDARGGPRQLQQGRRWRLQDIPLATATTISHPGLLCGRLQWHARPGFARFPGTTAKVLDGRPSKRPSTPSSPATTFCLRKGFKPVAAMSLLPWPANTRYQLSLRYCHVDVTVFLEHTDKGTMKGCDTWNRTDDVLHYQQQQLHASCHRGDEVDLGIAKPTAEPTERSEMKLQQAAFPYQIVVVPSGRLVLVSAAPDDCA